MHIVKLSAEGYSLQEVTIMLGVSELCVSKILRRNRDGVRPHQRRRGGRRSLTTTREDRQLIRMDRENRFISDMIRRFRRSLSVRSIVNRLLAIGLGILPGIPD